MAEKRKSLKRNGELCNPLHKADAHERATIYIGLGGTGADVVSHIKNEVCKWVRPDQERAGAPVHQNIKFLVIDSDGCGETGQESSDESLDESEYFCLRCENMAGALAKAKAGRDRQWLNPDLPSLETANGAGGIRQVGRFLLMENARRLRMRLAMLLTEAAKGDKDVDVCIYTGVSGGTGGAIFADVCYIIQDIAASMGMQRRMVTLFGYLFLPETQLSIPAISRNPALAKALRMNGYAALKEIDYLMSLEKNGGRFRQDYETFSIDSQKAPVHLCCLIPAAGQTDEDGEAVYRRTLCMAADWALALLVKPAEPGYMDCLGVQISTECRYLSDTVKKTYGAYCGYAIPGGAEVKVPWDPILSYLGAKLFERFSFDREAAPEGSHLSFFIEKNELSLDQILERLTEESCFEVPFLQYEPETLIQKERLPVDFAETWLSQEKEKLRKRRKAMEQPLRGYEPARGGDSLVSRIYSSLFLDYVRDRNYGPFFAANMLGGEPGPNLLQILDGYIADSETRLAEEQSREEFLAQAVQETLIQLKKSRAGFLGAGGRWAKAYLKALGDQYVHRLHMEKWRQMGELLQRVRAQAKELYHTYFQDMEKTLRDMGDAFEEERDFLLTGGEETGCGLHIWDTAEFKRSLDQAVEEVNGDAAMAGLLTRMTEQYPWGPGSEDGPELLALILSQFIANQFPDIMGKTVTDFLKEWYGAENERELAEVIRGTILELTKQTEERRRASMEPLYPESEMPEMSRFLIPWDVPRLPNGYEGGARRTELSDRIVCMSYTAAPLCAYRGMLELEQVYEEIPDKRGCHLYESEALDWREFLPSPIPDSFRVPGYERSRIKARNEGLIKRLEEAKEQKIVLFDRDRWIVRISRELDRKTVLEPCSVENAAAVIQRLKDDRDHRYDGERLDRIVEIPMGNAKSGLEDAVFRDEYLRFPDIQMLVETELEKIREINGRIAELTALLEKDKEDRRKHLFFDAIFAGTIETEVSRIVYRYEDLGSEETLVLQDSKMPYGICAVYQAYLNFKDVSDEMAALIQDETGERIDHLTKDSLKAAERLRERHSPEVLQILLDAVKQDPDRASVERFYEEFLQALRKFLLLYQA
mgnify:FL=1